MGVDGRRAEFDFFVFFVVVLTLAIATFFVYDYYSKDKVDGFMSNDSGEFGVDDFSSLNEGGEGIKEKDSSANNYEGDLDVEDNLVANETEEVNSTFNDTLDILFNETEIVNETEDYNESVDVLEGEGGDYYVTLSGSDSNNGSFESPWRTLNKAASSLVSGGVVLVGDGVYDEKVVVSNSGINDSYKLVFRSENLYGAKVSGFVVNSDYVSIDGFYIEVDSGVGIDVNSVSSVDILNNYVLECPSGGVDVTGGSGVNIIGNNFSHNGQWGIHIFAENVLIEDNEIGYTVQHHPKTEYTGYYGEDADGIRIFGSGHIVRGNYIHDLGNVEDEGNHQGLTDPNYPSDDYPHVDCLQSWDRSLHGGRPVSSNLLVEDNFCSLTRASGKGVMISAIDDSCVNVTIRNNIFEYRDIGISMNIGTFEDVVINNNLFKSYLNDNPWGAAVHLANIDGFEFTKNILVDGHAEARKIIGDGSINENLVWWSSGVSPVGTPGQQSGEWWGIDPEFEFYDGEHGGNYTLKTSSPIFELGVGPLNL